jgi:hypothetical protein
MAQMAPEDEPRPVGPWSKPSPLGYSASMDAMGTVASPLLAGFAFASVVVVSDDSGNFRWPGAGILGFSIAAVLFLGALEANFNARSFIWSAADVKDWWPEMEARSYLEDERRDEQNRAFERWRRWAKWARRMYNGGVLALLVGLSCVIPPPSRIHDQAALRWAAAGVVCAAFIAELVWMFASTIVRIRGRLVRGLTALGAKASDDRKDHRFAE